jgi:pimeloyl-ACP methyl ester carboxylesterase
VVASLPRRAFLGAELPGDEEAFADGGVRIAGVSAGGMAERAGMRGGDVMLALAGLPVGDLCQLGAALRAAGGAMTTELVWTRGTERMSKRVNMIAQPLEDLEGIEYGDVAVEGARLRTIATRVPAAHAIIVVIQGIACESIDHAATPEAPLAGLVAGWARAGYDTLRFDKRGVGDSEGEPCHTIDFATELADARAALARGRMLARVRGIPLVVFGHSVGGIMAAMLATEPNVHALMVYGTPTMRWLECLRDSTRRQIALRGAPEEELAARIAALDELLQSGELNGRSAAYHAGLEALDLEAVWRAVSVPVLVVRGEYDWVVRDDDQARIATLVTGKSEVVDVPGLDHLFGKHASREASMSNYGDGVFDKALVDATVAWLGRQVDSEPA